MEFATEKSKMFEGARPIIYTEQCPVFECYGSDLGLIAQQALFRKSPDWQYEKEWRLLWKEANQSRVFQPGTLSAVILGVRIRDADATQVKQWCQDIQPAPVIYRATLKDGVYGLDFIHEPLS
jgi:hypothetical protein